MKKHVTVVGALHIGISTLGLIGAIIMYIVLNGVRSVIPTEDMPDFVANLLSFIFTVLPVIAGIHSITGIIGGIGLLTFRPWGRIIALVVSFIGCLWIPIGTLLGVYSIWVLLNNEAIKLFDKQNL